MTDFTNYSQVIKLLDEAQDADQDNRERARESHDFVDKRDGQWESEIWRRMGDAGRPRYTLDKTNPIVNQIVGKIKQADFDIKVRPSGGDASKDTAKLLDGIIRNIENISNSSHVFSTSAKSMVTAGIDGWMIVQDWADTDAFEQDLFIKPVPNFVDSVWFDTNSQMQDRSDSKWAFKLTSFSPDAYKMKWPKGKEMSVGQDRTYSSYYNKPENIVVGECFYVKEVDRSIYKMTDGSVYAADDPKFIQLQDELAAAGVTVKETRLRKGKKVYIRQFDGSDWLGKEQETVFNWIPLIPTYGNFKVTDNKIIYRGVVDKLIDPQRIYNYARSRQIEEGALAPRDKIIATQEQVQGLTTGFETMNTNNEPVLLYNHVEGQPPPFKIGGSQVNPGLESTAMAANQDITQAAGLFAANMGENPGLQSGVAIDALKKSGDIGTIEYFDAQEVAICHTARILLDAIPKVYDTERQIRILNEDGSFDMQVINQPQGLMIDQQTGTRILLNDLSKGRYDVTCTVGKSFSSRQEESVAAIIEMAAFDPSVITEGGDILLSNSNAPGLDLIAERKRVQLFKAGLIPEDQWTEEETAQVQAQQQAAQNQPPPEDPLMIAAQAEMVKGQAEQLNAQNKQMEIQMTGQNKQMELQIRAQELQLKRQEQELETQKFLATKNDKLNVEGVKLDQSQQKIDLQSSKQQFDQMKAMMDQQQAQINDAVKNIQLLGDMDQFDYDPESQELIKRG